MKINTGADDAAGLAISEKMRSQIRGLDMASKNSQDAISLIQTADGGLTEINNMVQRIRELAVQAANDTNQNKDDVGSNTDASDTIKLAKEAQQLIDEIDAMAARTEFNKKKLLTSSNGATDSTGSSTFHMQVGANAGQSLNVVVNHITSTKLSLTGASAAIEDGASAASAYLTRIDEALRVVSEERANLGAFQNRLEYTIKSLDIASENTAASESRIRDADMAREMMNISKANVLQQAATSMLAQANQAPQNILQLLR
jgi:flagellin